MPPNFEEVEGHIAPGSSVRPFVRASVLNAFHILRAMHDRVLKFHIWWIRHQKLADPYFLFLFFFFFFFVLVRAVSHFGVMFLWRKS